MYTNLFIDEEAGIIMSLGKDKAASRGRKLGMNEVQVYQLRSEVRKRNAEMYEPSGREGLALLTRASTDMGNHSLTYFDEVSPGKSSGLPRSEIKKLADELRAQGGRNYTPVLIEEVGKDKYKVVGNAHIYEALQSVGTERMWTITVKPGDKPYTPYVPETPINISSTRQNQSSNTQKFRTTLEGSNMFIERSEIKKDSPSNATKAQINKLARQIKKQGRNWEPVVVQETGKDNYRIVRNAHVYEAAQKAGMKYISTVLVPSDGTTVI